MVIEVVLTIVGTLYLLTTSTFAFFGMLGLLVYIWFMTQRQIWRNPDGNDVGVHQIKFILTTENASVPQRGTRQSAGYDLKSAETCVISARSHKAVKTDIKVVLPKNTYGRIASRSGLSFRNGIEVGAGVIDEDYRKELMVNLHNFGDTDFEVAKNDRIAQFIVEQVLYPDTLVENINGTVTSNNTCVCPVRLDGFGSTGK